MGLLEDRLAQAAEKDEKGKGGAQGSGARGSSLGSIVKSKIRTQHQKVEEEEQDKK